MSSHPACRASPVGADEKSRLTWNSSRLSLSKFMSYLPLLSFGPSAIVTGSAYLLLRLSASECLTSVLTHSFSTRREVFFQRAPGTCILLEDDIGFGGPLEGLRFGVALGEPGLDGSLEFGDALEYAAADLLAGSISANSRSTRLIQDDDVGVKCSLKRGCLASQACTSLVLWYIRAVKNLTIFLGRSPDTATAEDLRLFQLHLTENRVRPPSINLTVTALRFFFTVTLDRADAIKHRDRAAPRTCPVLAGIGRQNHKAAQKQGLARIRTWEWRNQNPRHQLARRFCVALRRRVVHLQRDCF